MSAASAIRWAALRRGGGYVRPKPQGGDRLAQDGDSCLIHAALEEVPDITLPELRRGWVLQIAWGAPDLILDAGPISGVLPDLVRIAGNDESRALARAERSPAITALGARAAP